MALLLYSTPSPIDRWLDVLRSALPDMDIRTREEVVDPGEIAYVVAAMVPPGVLATFPNLRLIISLTAGVERLLADPELPDVPIARAGAPGGDDMINDFAMLHVLRHHRHMPAFAIAQQNAEWSRLPSLATSDRRVGIMGLGNIGGPVAERIRDLGFRVASWTRSPKSVPGIESFHGPEGFADFLARTDILINLLAVTPETENIINAELLGLLPKGAAVINLGRGQHVVDADLMAALDSGHIEAATLDVFREEPLPADHPFWAHPGITITPHASRTILPQNIVPQVAENVLRVEAGQSPLRLVDRAAGY